MTPVFLVGIFFFQYIAVSSKSKHAVITTGCLGSTARRASPTADGVVRLEYVGEMDGWMDRWTDT